MEDASGLDLSLFRLWYSQSGTPEVTMTRTHDPETGTLAVKLDQYLAPDRNQSEKQPMYIPVLMGLMTPDGRDVIPSSRRLFSLKKASETLVFQDIPPGTLPSLFREFSAPVRLRTDYSDTDLAFLMARDTDLFNRWDAAQQLLMREFRKLVNRSTAGTGVSPHLLEAFETALDDTDTDRAFLARALALPEETEIAEIFDVVDVEAVHGARQLLAQTLGLHFRDRFLCIVETCSRSAPGDLSFGAMADRSLKNLALGYIGASGTADSAALIMERFRGAGSMTDEIAALSILCAMNCPERDQALAGFYEKWKKDPLVMDKWFTAQALSPLPDTLDRVLRLAAHPDFTLKNPNRVRSLLGAFALQNPSGFHSADGGGYRFIADQIISLNRTNPQISARLASAFNRWKRYDDGRKTLMKQQLERIFSIRDISRDVFEIVSRALE
jgi:aminopeptidase N